MKPFILLVCLVAIHPFALQATDTRTTSLLLDISKSIPLRDFEKAKTVITKIAAAGDEADVTAIYLFGSKFEKVDAARLAAVQPTESNSAIYDSAYEAARDLSSLNAGRKTIVIFSDGYDTNSVITIEDLVSFARKEGIVIDSVGLGRSNRKVLERIAKLTGGVYLRAGDEDPAARIRDHVLPFTAAVPEEAPAKRIEPPARPSVPNPVTLPHATVSSDTNSTSTPYWIAGVLGALIALTALLFVAKRRRSKTRVCPSCGRMLEESQTACPDCISETRETEKLKLPVSGESTQELEESSEAEAPIPEPWPEPSQQTQEIMTQTYVLVETPVLIVKKGKHRGKSYKLDAEHPISIGRSRVNEIRVEDEATSAQHCRILPENGQHVLYDLDSTNGTYVGDSKIKRAPLNHGDTIKVGDTFLEYKIKQTRQ